MNRKNAPDIKDAIHYSLALKPYEYGKLDNGIDVYAISAGAQEVVQIEFVFFAGNFFEEKRGVAGATNFLLKSGTTSKTAFELNEAFDYYGGYCSRSCYNETATITLHCLTKHLKQLLPVVREMIVDSIFPKEELELYKQNSTQRLKINLQKADFVAGRLIDSYLYGEEHPYGTYTKFEDLDGLTIEDCKKFYASFYLNGGCKIFVGGLLPPGIISDLNSLFGQITTLSGNKNIPHRLSSPTFEKKFRIQNDTNAVQGAIRLGSPFPNRNHPDFKKVMVLNCLFGGYFGSRLMSNIREDKGYTYGIYSYIQNHIQDSAWIISTEAGKDVAEAAIEEVYKEMRILREEKIDATELMLVRNYMIGTILGDLDGPFQIIGKWKNIILNNLDETYFYDSVNEIKNTSVDELMVLANKYLQPNRFYELIVF
jgi:predicted Zn-dependent peptidase